MSASLSEAINEHIHDMQGEVEDVVKHETVAGIEYDYNTVHCSCGHPSGKNVIKSRKVTDS